jgi:hypothetical protein
VDEFEVFVHASGHIHKAGQDAVVFRHALAHGFQGLGAGTQVFFGVFYPFQDFLRGLRPDVELDAVGFEVLGPLFHVQGQVFPEAVRKFFNLLQGSVVSIQEPVGGQDYGYDGEGY